MSRDFIGSLEGRSFRQSPNRDRITRGAGLGALVAREVIGYWAVFTGGTYIRLAPDQTLWAKKYFRQADLTLSTLLVSGGVEVRTQRHILNHEMQDVVSEVMITVPEPATDGETALDIRRLVGAPILFISDSAGHINLGGSELNSLRWDLSEELDLELEYATLRSLLDGLSFPPVLLNPDVSGVGANDTLRTYLPDGAVVRTQNIFNVDAKAAIGGYTIGFNPTQAHYFFSKVPNLGVYTAWFGVHWVGIHLRDVLIGDGSKVWQFANVVGRIDLGLNEFSNANASSIHNVISETSCDVGSPGSILLAPEFDTLERGYSQYKSQSRVAFPAHKWTVPSFFGGLRQDAFTGVPPSCAPEFVGTSP